MSDSLTIALQPIHDAHYQHVADRLLYRQRHEAEDPLAETARALASAVYELNDTNRLGNRELFVDLPLGWLMRSELLPTPARLLIIGLDESLEITPALVRTLTDIRERGYRLAAPAALFKRYIDSLLPLVDIIRVSSPDSLDDDSVATMSRHKKRLMATDIRDQAQLEVYRQHDCDYFDGRYLAEPTFHASRPRGHHANRAAQLRLVNELYCHDADLHRLHELILQVPYLHVAILRRANSSFYSRGAKQTHLRQAIQLIGLHELRRLVLTLTLANDTPPSRLMVRMALTRAFMCRNLAAPFRNIDPEAAFITGLFSLMDILLDEDQKTLLEDVPLDPTVTRALTHGEGYLGAILDVAEGHERTVADTPEAEHPDQLQACYLKALDQTDGLMNLF